MTIFSNDFEAYTDAATSLTDERDANPTSAEWNILDDSPVGGKWRTGVQVIDGVAHSGTKALLLRSGTEAQVSLPGTRSGTSYQLDFWLHVVKGAGDRNWYVLVRGMGADKNRDDYVAYRTDRGATARIFYWDGIGPGAGAWVNTGAQHIESQWQHHRVVVDTAAQKCAIYIDDMTTPVVASGDLARPDVAVPMAIRLIHEGNSADDGYFVIDDISLTVDNSSDLTATFSEGFEQYSARIDAADDADPLGPWITVESNGTGSGKELTPAKVQVVDSSVMPARSGTKCLKLEGSQSAGASIAWGLTPQSDVEITWWARVPASVQGTVANYLRMSLYGSENGNSDAGDSALLGYGSRDATIGDATSLTYFTTGWRDSGVDYTPDTWEEYRLTTHNSRGRYTIVKNPSSGSPVIVADREAFIGSALNWTTFMAAWSSSNGADHPPVYIDDIQIKSIVSSVVPPPPAFTLANTGTRFTNVTALKVGGAVGKAAVDPRDNSTILFTIDDQPGGIFRARKVSSGTWSVDPTPVVSGLDAGNSLDRPSGLTVDSEGTIWWTHDFTMSLRRLRAPWDQNVVEQIISNFGSAATDDDTIDVAVAPTTFSGSLGQPGMIVIADRGVDGDANNGIFLVDPATTVLNQSTYETYLVPPTASGVGSANLNSIAPLPQYGEIVTLSTDGFIAAVNGDGTVRQIIPTELWTDFLTGGPAPVGTAHAVDPLTGRIWIADDGRDQVWSIDSNPANQGPDRMELAFPLADAVRTDLQVDFHDPGMTFAPNGDFMVLTDSGVANGGERLLIFHNEQASLPPFRITQHIRSAEGFVLSWQSAGAVTYHVERGTDIANPASFVKVSGDLTATTFTDANVPTGAVFYRVVAKP